MNDHNHNLTMLNGLMEIQKESSANLVSPPTGWKVVCHRPAKCYDMVLFPDGTVRECMKSNDTAVRTIVTRARWRASHGSFYFYLNAVGSVCKTKDDRREGDTRAFNVGNYFQTYGLATEKREVFMKVFNDRCNS